MFWFWITVSGFIGFCLGVILMSLLAMASKSERDASQYYDQTPDYRPRVGSLQQYRRDSRGKKCITNSF